MFPRDRENRPALIKIIALRRAIDKTSSGLVFRATLVTHMCVTQPQQVNNRCTASVMNDIIQSVVVINNLC